MPQPRVRAEGKKFQIVVGETIVLESESQGEIEETLRKLRKKPKLPGQTLPTATEPVDSIQEMFDNIESHFQSYLTDWEEGFVLETQEWYTEKKMLSPLQRLKLEDILSRCVKRANSGV